MITKNIFYYLFASLLLIAVSCVNGDREKQLERREQELLLKEKEFAKKDAEYQSLLKFRDSLAVTRDTSFMSVWPDSIAGQWNAKLVCTESNCSNYVVGDQRNDQWEFSSDSTNLLAKVTGNNQLVRIYTGSFEGNKIILHFESDPLAQKKIEMKVEIDQITANKMRGTRTNKGTDNCTAVFSVELNRIQKKE